MVMALQIALLRGINVGGRKVVAMNELCAMVESLGIAAVRSVLQSGNLVFEGGRRTAGAIERMLEAETAKRLKIEVSYFVRGAEEMRRVVAGNPFEKEAARDPSHLVVVFLKEAVEAKAVKGLQPAIVGTEEVRAAGRELYAWYPAGIGTSKLTNAVIERKLGVRGTARNWNTVKKLVGMVG